MPVYSLNTSCFWWLLNKLYYFWVFPSVAQNMYPHLEGSLADSLSSSKAGPCRGVGLSFLRCWELFVARDSRDVIHLALTLLPSPLPKCSQFCDLLKSQLLFFLRCFQLTFYAVSFPFSTVSCVFPLFLPAPFLFLFLVCSEMSFGIKAVFQSSLSWREPTRITKSNSQRE